MQWEPILNRPALLEWYNACRIERYGPDGALPVEFLPAYLRLRNDPSRIIAVEDECVMVAKHVKIFAAQYIRMEGLPISLDNVTTNETKLLPVIEQNVGRLRLCQKEAALLYNKNFEEESAIANFWSLTIDRLNHVNRSQWRSSNGVNLATSCENLRWRMATPPDWPSMRELYRAWTEDKHEHIMYKKLYENLIGPSGHTKDTVTFALTFGSIVVGMCSWVMDLLDNACAHLVMNVSIDRTSIPTPPEFDPIRKYTGSLLHWYSVNQFYGRSKYLFLGYCDKGDKLIEYKRKLSHGETRLFISEPLNTMKNKQPAAQGFGL